MANKKFGEWISVEDELPEVNTHVLVYTENGGKNHPSGVEADCFIVSGYCPDSRPIFCHCDPYVTHWMPMPEVPGKQSIGETVENKKFGEWRSVHDELPETNMYVLVYTGNCGKNFTPGINVDHSVILPFTVPRQTFWNFDSFVTHWMPLPEPPKK